MTWSMWGDVRKHEDVGGLKGYVGHGGDIWGYKGHRDPAVSSWELVLILISSWQDTGGNWWVMR